MSESKNLLKLKEDELDLIALVKTLWHGRKTIIKITIVFTLIGLFVALFSQKEYTATTTMVPQLNSAASKLGGLSSLASLAGFNLDMSGDGNDISPVIYPKIVSSISFQLEIMNSIYSFDEPEKELSLYDYYINYYKPSLLGMIKKYTIGLPEIIISQIGTEKKLKDKKFSSGSEIIQITKDQRKVCKLLDRQLYLNINDKDGFLTIESRFNEPELSAQIAERALVLLQDKIIKFKIEKAKEQLDFIHSRYEETKKEFELAQINLAKFRDENRSISSAIAQTKQEKLENEYQLAFEVYSELAKQFEQARIKVKEDTPVFTVIDPVVVPIKKSKPRRLLILTLWFSMGLLYAMIKFLISNHIRPDNRLK